MSYCLENSSKSFSSCEDKALGNYLAEQLTVGGCENEAELTPDETDTLNEDTCNYPDIVFEGSCVDQVTGSKVDQCDEFTARLVVGEHELAEGVIEEGFNIYSDHSFAEHPIYLTQLPEEQYEEYTIETRAVEDVATARYAMEATSPTHVMLLMDNSKNEKGSREISGKPLAGSLTETAPDSCGENETERNIVTSSENNAREMCAEENNDLSFSNETTETSKYFKKGNVGANGLTVKLEYPMTKQRSMKRSTMIKTGNKDCGTLNNNTEVASTVIEDTIVDGNSVNLKESHGEGGVSDTKARNEPSVAKHQAVKRRLYCPEEMEVKTEAVVVATSESLDLHQLMGDRFSDLSIDQSQASRRLWDFETCDVSGEEVTEPCGRVKTDMFGPTDADVNDMSKHFKDKVTLRSSQRLQASGSEKFPRERSNVKYSIIERKFKVADRDKKALEEYLAQRDDKKKWEELFARQTDRPTNSSQDFASARRAKPCGSKSFNSSNQPQTSSVHGHCEEKPSNSKGSQIPLTGSEESPCPRVAEPLNSDGTPEMVQPAQHPKRNKRRQRVRRKPRLLPAIPQCEPFSRNQGVAQTIHRIENDVNHRKLPDQGTRARYNVDLTAASGSENQMLSEITDRCKLDVRTPGATGAASDNDSDEVTTCRRVEYSRDSLIITFNEQDGTLKIRPRLENGVLVTKPNQEPEVKGEEKRHQGKCSLGIACKGEKEGSAESFCIEFRDDVYRSDSGGENEKDGASETRTQL